MITRQVGLPIYAIVAAIACSGYTNTFAQGNENNKCDDSTPLFDTIRRGEHLPKLQSVLVKIERLPDHGVSSGENTVELRDVLPRVATPRPNLDSAPPIDARLENVSAPPRPQSPRRSNSPSAIQNSTRQGQPTPADPREKTSAKLRRLGSWFRIHPRGMIQHNSSNAPNPANRLRFPSVRRNFRQHPTR